MGTIQTLGEDVGYFPYSLKVEYSKMESYRAEVLCIHPPSLFDWGAVEVLADIVRYQRLNTMLTAGNRAAQLEDLAETRNFNVFFSGLIIKGTPASKEFK